MFTGLIEQKAEVLENKGNRLTLRASLASPLLGESIAVNGVCLTLSQNPEEASSKKDSILAFDLSPETLGLTNLGQLSPGDWVNLERAMLASARFGGHYVSGHVDTTASVLALKPSEDCLEVLVGDFQMLASAFLLPKGSITLDGVSLTINRVEENNIRLMLVPHTLAITNLGRLKLFQRINVEFDYIARIIAHQFAISGHLEQVLKNKVDEI